MKKIVTLALTLFLSYTLYAQVKVKSSDSISISHSAGNLDLLGKVNLKDLAAGALTDSVLTVMPDGRIRMIPRSQLLSGLSSGNFIQNQNTAAQTANMWISGGISADNLLLAGTYGGTVLQIQTSTWSMARFSTTNPQNHIQLVASNGVKKANFGINDLSEYYLGAEPGITGGIALYDETDVKYTFKSGVFTAPRATITNAPVNATDVVRKQDLDDAISGISGGDYLPLSGGTLTGALAGTSASFSSNVGIGTTTPTGTGSKVLSIAGSGGGVNQYGSLSLSNESNSGGNILGSIDFYGQDLLYNAIRGTTNGFRFYTRQNTAHYQYDVSLENGVLSVGNPSNVTSGSVAIYNSIGSGQTNSGLELGNMQTGANSNIDIRFVDYQSNPYGIIRGLYSGTAQTGGISFMTANGTAAAEAMRITAAGKIGIGTNTPSETLDVIGKAKVSVAPTDPTGVVRLTDLETAISGISTSNFVDMSSHQTGIGGNKTWAGNHAWEESGTRIKINPTLGLVTGIYGDLSYSLTPDLFVLADSTSGTEQKVEMGIRNTKYENNGYSLTVSIPDLSQNSSIDYPNKSGTLAIDGDVVHNTGTETINGLKIFNSKLDAPYFYATSPGNGFLAHGTMFRSQLTDSTLVLSRHLYGTGAARLANNSLTFSVGSYGIKLTPASSIGADRTQALQDLDGTLALIIQDTDYEVTNSSRGVILKSPNGTRWRITISDTGVLTTTSL